MSNYDDDLRTAISQLDDARSSIISLVNINGWYFIPDGCQLINIAKFIADPPIYLTFNLSTNDLVVKTPTNTSGYCMVSWGDDSRSISDGQVIHHYESSGIKTISITGEVTETFNTLDAFSGLTNLTRVVVGAPIIFGKDAFKGCTALTQVRFQVADAITEVGESAFEGCTSLTTITLPTSTKKIGKSAFKNCTSLTTINLGSLTQLEEIGEGAFEGCSSLTTVTLPASMKSIGLNAFNTNVKKFYINWSDPTSVNVAAGAFKSDMTWKDGKVVVPSGALDNYVYRSGGKQHLTTDAANYPTTNSFTYRDYDF